MDEIINKILELYFSGYDLKEILSDFKREWELMAMDNKKEAAQIMHEAIQKRKAARKKKAERSF